MSAITLSNLVLSQFSYLWSSFVCEGDLLELFRECNRFICVFYVSQVQNAFLLRRFFTPSRSSLLTTVTDLDEVGIDVFHSICNISNLVVRAAMVSRRDHKLSNWFLLSIGVEVFFCWVVCEPVAWPSVNQTLFKAAGACQSRTVSTHELAVIKVGGGLRWRRWKTTQLVNGR